jgi:hypothetical protein
MIAGATDNKKPHPFSILTEERTVAICKAINDANLSFQQILVQDPTLLKGMDQRDKTQVLRAVLVAKLRDALGDQVGVGFRKDQGIFLIAIDRLVLIHLKKVKGSASLGSVPKTLQKAKHQPSPNLLPEFDEVMEEKSLPLSYYDHYLVAAYVLDALGLISEFYFNVQDGPILLDQRPLDLSGPTVHLQATQSDETDEVIFTLKKDEDDDDLLKAVGI